MSYRNSLPFIYGLEHTGLMKFMQLITDTPANCAKLLINHKADIGLVPAATIPEIKQGKVITDFCISADGPVDSVLLFSKEPVQGIKKIVLDYQSRTSVELVKILCRDAWQISPQFINGQAGYENDSSYDAKLIIGDRAFVPQPDYPVVTDLSQAWKEHTGLPFVFACWVSILPDNPDILVNTLNNAFEYGTTHISEVVNAYKNKFSDMKDPHHYLEHRIEYNLNDEKRQGLKEFLSRI